MTRVKGEDTLITLVSSTGTETSFGDVKSFDLTFERDILSEGYLGQNTEKKDDIFKGVTGKMVVHFEKADALDLIGRMNAKTQKRLPGEQFEIASTITFPDGSKRRIVLSNVAIGSIPIGAGSRADYVEISLDIAADDGAILPG